MEAMKANGQARNMREETRSSRTGNTVTDIRKICRERETDIVEKILNVLFQHESNMITKVSQL